jgi:hypothetical protein
MKENQHQRIIMAKWRENNLIMASLLATSKKWRRKLAWRRNRSGEEMKVINQRNDASASCCVACARAGAPGINGAVWRSGSNVCP